MKTGVFFEVGAAGQFLGYLLENNWKTLVHERERDSSPMFVPASFTEIYDRWTGYFVEPLSFPMSKMLEWDETHPDWDAHYIQCAVSGKNQLREMSVIEFVSSSPWQMGTLSDESFYESWAQKANTLWVQTLTLDTLFSSLGVYPDLLRIDIEGAEVDALEAYSFNPPPRIIQVDYHQNRLACMEILEANNYRIMTDKWQNHPTNTDYDIYAIFEG